MTLKLYYTPGACSLSPHIVLREAGLPFELVKVDAKSKKLPNGESFTTINSKGYVPCLEVAPGQYLTEGPAIVQYVADLAPQAGLAPPNGTLERARLQEWLNFITSELHKGFSPLFAANTPDAYQPIAREKVLGRLRWVDAALGGRSFVTGETFTVADAYLFVVCSWSGYVGLDLSELRRLGALVARIKERPHVRAALAAEGLS